MYLLLCSHKTVKPPTTATRKMTFIKKKRKENSLQITALLLRIALIEKQFELAMFFFVITFQIKLTHWSNNLWPLCLTNLLLIYSAVQCLFTVRLSVNSNKRLLLFYFAVVCSGKMLLNLLFKPCTTATATLSNMFPHDLLSLIKACFPSFLNPH